MKPADHHARVPLTALPPRASAVVDSIEDGIDPAQQEQLVAYGLAPGRPLRMQQQQPMTLVLIDEVELALEAGVARRIWVRKA
ncbi:MAG: FeoA family protein [Pseudomonadota bacterium]